MNNTLLLISIVGSVVLVVLGLMFIAGFLLRRDRARLRTTRFSTPKLARDPLALKTTLVEFFACSKGSSRMIRLLAARRKPLGYRALVDEIRFDERWRRDSDGLPASAIFALLGIMQVAGLVRLTRQGFSITEIGRVVQRCIEPDRPAQMPQIRGILFHSGNETRTDAALSSGGRGTPALASRPVAPPAAFVAIRHERGVSNPVGLRAFPLRQPSGKVTIQATP